MNIGRISRRTFPLRTANTNPPSPRWRVQVVRTFVAVTLSFALVGTAAIELPSLSSDEAGIEIPPPKGPQLEPADLADIERVHEDAGMLASPLKETVSDVAKALPSTAAKIAKATTAVTGPIAEGVNVFPTAASIVRATAHEAIKMKKGILPLIPSKFARAEEGVTIPVSLTQYCVQGETRRGRQTRHGIVAADPRIFPLSRYVDVFLNKEYLGRYLVDDTGGNVLGATLDIWNTDLREGGRLGRHWVSAMLVARQVEQVPNDSLAPTRWDGLARR